MTCLTLLTYCWLYTLLRAEGFWGEHPSTWCLLPQRRCTFIHTAVCRWSSVASGEPTAATRCGKQLLRHQCALWATFSRLMPDTKGPVHSWVSYRYRYEEASFSREPKIKNIIYSMRLQNTSGNLTPNVPFYPRIDNENSSAKESDLRWLSGEMDGNQRSF